MPHTLDLNAGTLPEIRESPGAQAHDADVAGYVPAGRGRRPADWKHRQARLVSVLENAAEWSMHKWEYEIREAMLQDQFPLLFGDTLGRELAAELQNMGTPLDPLFRRRRMKDFRAGKTIFFEGLEAPLEQIQPLGPYNEATPKEVGFTIQLHKWGKRISFPWESYINDDLGAFSRFASGLAKAAINTRARVQSLAFWGATGPNTSVFAETTTGFNLGQQGLSVLPLTITNLGVALAAMTGGEAGYRTLGGEPFLNNPVYLVVGTGNRINALSILKSVELQTAGIAASATQYATANVIRDFNLKLIVDPYIDIIVTTGTVRKTMWGLFTDTTFAGEMALRATAEMPQLFIRKSNAELVGGGESDPMDGDFDSDSGAYKIRDCMDAAASDPRAGWASTGAGA